MINQPCSTRKMLRCQVFTTSESIESIEHCIVGGNTNKSKIWFIHTYVVVCVDRLQTWPSLHLGLTVIVCQLSLIIQPAGKFRGRNPGGSITSAMHGWRSPWYASLWLVTREMKEACQEAGQLWAKNFYIFIISKSKWYHIGITMKLTFQ